MGFLRKQKKNQTEFFRFIDFFFVVFFFFLFWQDELPLLDITLDCAKNYRSDWQRWLKKFAGNLIAFNLMCYITKSGKPYSRYVKIYETTSVQIEKKKLKNSYLTNLSIEKFFTSIVLSGTKNTRKNGRIWTIEILFHNFA